VLEIAGMHCVGKSTLLYLLNTTYSNNHPFDHVFHMRVGSGCTVAKIQDFFAWVIGLGRCPGMSDVQFTEIISRRLKHKRLLLLLDDVRDGGNDLSAISLPIPLVGHRQKVFFTTRDQAVCANMGCAAANTIQMQCLGEDDACDLFRYHVAVKPSIPMH